MNDIAFLNMVERCYSALDHPGGFQALTRQLGAVLGADAGDIVTEDRQSGAIRTHGSFGFDPSFLSSYDVEFLGENPWLDTLTRHAPGQVRDDIEETPGFRDSAYYNDWVRPQNLDRSLGAVLPVPGRGTTWVGFARARGARAFGVERNLLQRLLPHLTRAVSLADRLVPSAQPAALDLMPDPALRLDAGGCLIEANAAGRGYLSGHGLMLTRGGMLEAVRRQDNRGLAGAIKSVTKGRAPEGQVCLVHRGEAPPLALLLSPWRADRGAVTGLIVRLRDEAGDGAELDLRPLALAYRLTATELALVRCLVAGGRVDEFAQDRGMKLSTARWHLKNAETKTGTSRSEQLVSLAFRMGFSGATEV